MYFISTLSVFVSSNLYGNHIEKSLMCNDEYHLYGGYAQSKYIGEKIMEKYQKNIIRLGLITGTSEKGIFPEDFFSDFIKINKKIGEYPENYENSYVDITPVDYAVEKIIEYVNNPINKIMSI